MREGERDIVESNAPRRSTYPPSCQINLLRDDAAGRARGSDGRGGGWSVGARRRPLKQESCTGRRRELVRSRFISTTCYQQVIKGENRDKTLKSDIFTQNEAISHKTKRSGFARLQADGKKRTFLTSLPKEPIEWDD